MASRITPIILCGGSGTRLWPASRESFPKQFLALAGEETLLQATLARVSDPERFAPAIVVANDAHRFIVAEQVSQCGAEAEIVLEPCRRDSAAAIGAAMRLVEARDPDGLALALASDHVVQDPAAFLDAVETARPAALAGRIVTFGLTPKLATSRYGYIRAGREIDGAPGVFAVSAFVEKPDQAGAERLVAEGCFWNSGNFFARAGALLDEMRRLAPDIAGPAAEAADKALRDLDFIRLDSRSFEAARARSIDYAVMEKTPSSAVAPCSIGWSDVGGWTALWEIAERDAAGNALVGPVRVADASNCYVRSDKALTAVVGLDDAVVVAAKDAVLVTTRARADEVKDLVARLAAEGEEAATVAPSAHRPWGSYEIIDRGERFQVKRITVNPGRKLSLQSHLHRAEHWVVVEGTARVTVGDETRLVETDQSVYIPLGAKHRLENPGVIPLRLIEVQSGAYLGEDDILRYEDDYRRS